MNAIVAVDRNWAIGREGDQLVYLKEDLKRFRTLTAGHAVLVGRKTLATFPGGRPLKGRENLVLSRDTALTIEGARVFHRVEDLAAAAPADAFVVGGAQVYEALLPWCDTVYVTRIDTAFPGCDAFFPDLDSMGGWTVEEEGEPLEENGLTYRYVTYRRDRHVRG